VLARIASNPSGWTAKQKPASFEATMSTTGTSDARSADASLPKLTGSVNNTTIKVIIMNYTRGLRAGIPIALGYLSVSFTFGILAVRYGLTVWQATLVSLTTVTSAGQFAGIQMMASPGLYLDMLISQLTINVRYSFMSISLSQKLDAKFRGVWKWILGFFITDEIFAVAVTQPLVTRSFFAGLSTLPWIGWTVGTALGASMGEILPAAILSALGIALYGMFVAIVVPPAKENRYVLLAAAVAAAISTAFAYVPFLKKISSGIAISIAAIVAAAVAAIIHPVEEEPTASDDKKEVTS